MTSAVPPLRAAIRHALTVTGSASTRRLTTSPVVTTVAGRAVADVELLGIGTRAGAVGRSSRRRARRRRDRPPPSRRALARARSIGADPTAPFAEFGGVQHAELGDKTQTRPDAVCPGSTSGIVSSIDTKLARDDPTTAQELWGACQGTVDSGVVEPGVERADRVERAEDVDDSTFRITLAPELGHHARTRVTGCLEDTTLDPVVGRVVSVTDRGWRQTGPVDEAVAAWRELCRRAEALGDRLLTDEFPADDAGRADGVRHLVEQVVTFLGWSVLHADPRRPAFQRHNDLVGRWGGPNVDNVYRHARVDPSLRYRIRGRMHSCDDWVLAVRAGFMHMPAWGTLRTLTASELGIARGDDFEVVLDDLPDGAVMLSVREYYVDWQADDPATFTIECLDDAGPGAARGDRAVDVAAHLRDAAEHIERSMTYWNRFLVDARAGQDDNAFTPPVVVGKGLSMARYAYCFWSLDDEEALVVDCDVPAARYWSFQLYNLGWFEAFDVDDRIVSVNNAQAVLSDDARRVSVVVSAADPGVANWLDPGGRRNGLLMLRWFWPDEDAPAPSPSTRVVPVASLSGPIDAGSRRAERRARLDHLAWRFRT